MQPTNEQLARAAAQPLTPPPRPANLTSMELICRTCRAELGLTTHDFPGPVLGDGCADESYAELERLAELTYEGDR